MKHSRRPRAERRVEAEDRQSKAESRMPAEQLERLDKRPGDSWRERNKIEKAMSKWTPEKVVTTRRRLRQLGFKASEIRKMSEAEAERTLTEAQRHS